MSEEVTVEEVRAFITSGKKWREPWLDMAKRSWNELKKRRKDGMLWSTDISNIKRRNRYPAWFSIQKILRPLILARAGIPVGKDTTQEGTDPVGATAAICKERLAKGMAREFDNMSVKESVRDDFCATDFGLDRLFYQCEQVKERVKEYITPEQRGEDMIFVDSKGNEVLSDDIVQEGDAFYIETEQVTDVKEEKFILKHVLYKNFIVEHGVAKWDDVKRCAFIEYYSKWDFIRKFGPAAFTELPNDPEVGENAEMAAKNQSIEVYEYWDKYTKETYYLAANGKSFITPRVVLDYEEEDEELSTRNGIYDLRGFFPCSKPLILNAATDDFWPTCQYYQIWELLESLNSIFSRSLTCVRAMRARGMFDANIDGLKEALNELTESDMIGIPNLSQALQGSGGSLEAAVQYIPVEKIVGTLASLNDEFEKKLYQLFRITGISDMLQGMQADPTARTLGEQQMKERYALNQLETPMRKMQEFVRDDYELLTEAGLKNFRDETLAKYIMPETLQPDDQKNYPQAMRLLKEDTKRFRIELETDSTIAINEEFDKQVRIELVNALTTALEKTAQIAQTAPELAIVELEALKFLVQGFRQGKLFQAEITQAIDNVIQAKQNVEQAFDKDKFDAELASRKLELEQMKIATSNQLSAAELQSKERIEMMKLQLSQSVEGLRAQLESMRTNADIQQSGQDVQLQYQKISADIALMQQELALKREELMLEASKANEESSLKAAALNMDATFGQLEFGLKQAQQNLDAQYQMLDEREKYMTEERLQAEHQLEVQLAQMDMLLKAKEAVQVQQPAINITPPAEPKRKRVVKVKQDKKGRVEEFEVQNQEG